MRSYIPSRHLGWQCWVHLKKRTPSTSIFVQDMCEMANKLKKNMCDYGRLPGWCVATVQDAKNLLEGRADSYKYE